jgi:hypothetical protein
VDINAKLKIAANQAGLTPEQMKQIDGLGKLVTSHQNLQKLPQQQSEQAFSQLTKDQQEAHIAMFGGEDPRVPEKRSVLGSAFYYATAPIKQVIGRTFGALNEASDFMTRLYRTGAIAIDQGVDLGKAFDIANDKGDKVFIPDRIKKAQDKYGMDYVSVAMKLASGTKLADVIAEGTEAEKQIASKAAQLKETGEVDFLLQDSLDAVQAAKYSPGRFIANLLTPENLEGSGALYKGISGFVDGAYRIFSDPTLALGKAKKAYDATNYALFKIVGNAGKVDEVFQNKGVVNLFDRYGAELEKLSASRKTDDLKAGVEASKQLRILAPEFGPAAIDEFIRAGVKNADTAKNYLANGADMRAILSGQAARKTPLIPRLNASRLARITFLTTANKIFDIDKVGQRIVSSLYGADEIQTEDIITGLTENAEAIAKQEKGLGKFRQDGATRLNLNTIQGKIDRFARKFETIPYFKDGWFDVNSADGANKIYSLARLSNSKYHSKIIAEAFAAGDEGQKKQIFTGLWGTIAEVRGVSKTKLGIDNLAQQTGNARAKQYAPTVVTKRSVNEFGDEVIERVNPANFDGEQMALFPYQLSSGISVPSIVDLDRLSARSGLVDRMLGVSHSKWADRMTSFWSFGTIAGPRFPVRNAAEDLMVHIAAGDSTWGLVKGRILSTRLRLASKDQKVGFINKLIRRSDLQKYQDEIAPLIAAGDVNAVQTVMAKALLEDGLGHKFDKFGAEILAQHARLGYLPDTLASVSEGGKYGVLGADQYLNVTDDVSKFGTSQGALEIDGIKYKQDFGGDFTDFNPVMNQQARISWFVQLNVLANDELGSIAMRYMGDSPQAKQQAIKEITKYLDNLPEKARNRFTSIATGKVTTTGHAERVYEATKAYVSKRDGKINQDLLSKIRQIDEDGVVNINPRGIGLEDLPDKMNAEFAPEFISGPTIIPLSDTDNFAVSFMDKSWDYMGEANARFSREPLVLQSIIRTRKDMKESGFEDNIMARFTANKSGKALEDAKIAGEKHIVTLAEDLAKNRVLAYVDNPAVRSQLAMSVRNFARFYRATEDFYRRMYRTVKYNPEAIAKASLTYEGIAHSGFVQTDDNGDQYFFYPGLTPVYKVMGGVANLFGVKDAFQVPMPVEFGAKLKMITPSLNPDSLFPTFAGPVASLPLKLIGNVVPQIKDLEQYLLGAYGEDQPMISAVLPAHLNRALATLDRDERSSQYASAFRKGATYLEATGHGLKPVFNEATGQYEAPSAGDIAAYQDKLQASSITVLAMRFMFGFVAPASPQVTLKSDMAKWVRDNGATNFKQVFNQLVNKYDDIDKATQEWIRLFPDQMPYTVSESDRNTVAWVRAVEDAGNFIEQNPDLLKKYPQAAAFLIPRVGEFDFNAYKLLSKSGLKRNKTVTDFLGQVSSAKDIQYYYQQKEDFDSQMAMLPSSGLKSQLRNQWQTWSEQYKGARPLLQDQLGAGGQRQVDRVRALEDLRKMVSDPEVTVQKNSKSALARMIQAYDNYTNQRDTITSLGGGADDFKDMLKQNIKTELQDIASKNSNAKAAYDVLFARLIGD